MKKRIMRYFLHLIITLLLLIVVGFTVVVCIGGSLHYSDDPRIYAIDREGPYVFYENDSTLSVNYIRGDRDSGFSTETETLAVGDTIAASCYFALDDSRFGFSIVPDSPTPGSVYEDGQPILVISDVESGFKAFRDFLIANEVVDEELNWTFGRGHLVLLGDFVDRGNSTVQVLWFIYYLEQAARRAGGVVHYLIGNHEIKNMEGKFGATSQKYYGVAAILGKQLHELFNDRAFLGRWMASKNVLEMINGHLFAHGGIHPSAADLPFSIEEINRLVRNNYRLSYYPEVDASEAALLWSTRTGIAWYRGYFKEELSQADIDGVLSKFGAKSIVVGHTLQDRVKRKYNGRVIAVDVKHPKDYEHNFPSGKSEGLLIQAGEHFRLLSDGRKIRL